MRYPLPLAVLLLAAPAAAQHHDTTPAHPAPAHAQATHAADQQWLARETSAWQAVRDKKSDAFAALLDPGFQAIDSDGVHDKAANLAMVPQTNMRSFQLSDFTARQVDPRSVVLTYKATVEGDAGGTDFSGAYWCSSVWRLVGGHWRAILHTESKAP
jgi:hypothetical protein